MIFTSGISFRIFYTSYNESIAIRFQKRRKNNMFTIGVVLICAGLILLVMDHK